MSSENPKRALYAAVRRRRQGDRAAHRLELLEQVAQGERSVEALAERTGCRSPTPRSICSTCGARGWSRRDGRPSSCSTAWRTTPC